MLTGWAWAYWPSGPFVGLSTFSGSAVISRRISNLPSGAGVDFGAALWVFGTAVGRSSRAAAKRFRWRRKESFIVSPQLKRCNVVDRLWDDRCHAGGADLLVQIAQRSGGERLPFREHRVEAFAVGLEDFSLRLGRSAVGAFDIDRQ